tara:strand:- start:1708 stop:2301 length:594 start_codon:yes stop_codon:yes gene_type:complete
MKMILLGYAHTKSGPFTNLTNGKAYDHIGQGFSDDKGLTRLVSHFRWKVLPLGASYPDDINYADHISEGAELRDDDREEPLPFEDSHEALTFGPLSEDTAMRFNNGKSELSYMMSLPNASAGVSAAFAMGAKKYARDNWKKGLDRNQIVDSALRHLMKSQNGEVFDEESGLDHLFHFAWNALVLAEQEGLVKTEGVV